MLHLELLLGLVGVRLHLGPVLGVLERVVDMRASLAESRATLDIALVEEDEVEHLHDTETKHDDEDDHVGDEAGAVVGRLVGKVELGTDHLYISELPFGMIREKTYVTDTETDKEHAGGGSLLGVSGGIGESPRKDERSEGLEDLEDKVDNEQATVQVDIGRITGHGVQGGGSSNGEAEETEDDGTLALELDGDVRGNQVGSDTDGSRNHATESAWTLRARVGEKLT